MKNKLIQIVYVALFFMATAMISLCMVSCDEGGIDSQVNGDLRVGTTAQASYTVSASAATIKFNVTSNTPWEISSDQSWCTVTPVSSTVSALVQEVTIATEVNPDAKARTAVLTIKGDGVDNQTVKVTQDAKGELNVAMFETSELFGRTGGTRQLTILSNKPWTINSDKSWLTFDITSGEGSDDMYVVNATVAENSGNMRKAIITIKTNSVDSVYEITQDGNLLEVTNIADSMYNGTVQTQTYNINANMSWKATVDSEYGWIHITSSATGDESGELTIEVDENNVFSAEDRVGYIKISPTTPIPGLEDVYITVRQSMAFTILTPASTTINADGTVTMTGAGGELQMQTKGVYGLGTFTWKFASVNIPENGELYIAGDANVNSKFWIYPTEFKFWSGGDWGWSWADMGMLSLQGNNLNDLTEWKLDFDLDPANTEKVIVDVYFNGSKIFTRTGLKNPFTNASNKYPFYFGCTGSGASCVLESITFEPKE